MSSPIENQLKCLTLTPPWSSLVMIPAKRIETRSWSTSYRGLLGIHAAKGFPKDARALCQQEPFRTVLQAAGFASAADLPTSALLGTVRLVNCIRTEEIAGHLSEQELAFGDYSWGRWAWVFDDVRPFVEPIPMHGALGLWTTDYRLSEWEVAG
jgi:activating signal cointegrator 1